MKSKIKSIFVILTLVILTASCKKSNNSSNATNGTFTLKYEIITSSPIITNPLLGTTAAITYGSISQVLAYDYSFVAGSTSWTKEINPTGPYLATLGILGGVFYLSSPGTVTGNIYVNGNRVAQRIITSTFTSGTNQCSFNLLQYDVP